MFNNDVPLRVERNAICLSTRYLGTSRCFVWVGWWFGPTDNDTGRVVETRDLMQRHYDYVPYGMFVGNLGSTGRFTEALINELGDGYYRLRLDGWPEGVYRFNYHGPDHIASPDGTPLSGRRDANVSWARWWSDDVPFPARSQIRDFVYEEPNGAGHCFRVLIDRDRTVRPFGNLDAHKNQKEST